MPVALIVGISSDIGRELALRYAVAGWTVWGTHRNADPGNLPTTVRTIHCDLMCPESLVSAVDVFVREDFCWDLMVIAVGTEEPIGPFFDCDELAWEEGIQVNTLAPLRLIRRLYPMRNQAGSPSVAFFSGSGTNNAAPAYSAYCASKIMLIKMCELLDAESSDTSFFIVGPGIVRTKIHEQTLRTPERSGENYRKVVSFINSDDPGTAHDDIYACLNWCSAMGKAVIGGRNLSLVYDAWRNGGDMLARRLAGDGNLYKLRRFGNDMQIVTTKT